MKINLLVRNRITTETVAEMVFEESTLMAFAGTGLRMLLTPENEIVITQASVTGAVTV